VEVVGASLLHRVSGLVTLVEIEFQSLEDSARTLALHARWSESEMDARVRELVAQMPTAWLENYVECFEAGRVQKHPQARFVNERGECCLVAALAGARDAASFVRSEHWVQFLGTGLEQLSRMFESRRLTGQELYEEVLLALTERRGARAPVQAEAAAGASAGN